MWELVKKKLEGTIKDDCLSPEFEAIEACVNIGLCVDGSSNSFAVFSSPSNLFQSPENWFQWKGGGKGKILLFIHYHLPEM